VKHVIVALTLAGSIVATVAAQNADPQGPRRSDDGVTPLLTAIYHGDVQAVDRLIAAGANVRAANREGVTPLSMACLDGDLPIIDRLLKAGADPKERGPNGETLLMFAARNGRVDVITRLVAAGAEVNARERLRGTTALMWAAEQRHPEAVKALLAAGADPGIASGPAGLPRNYMAPRVDVNAVQEARQRRARATAAGRTYDEQVAFERRTPVAASPG
jgi:ankyrin repeat protein